MSNPFSGLLNMFGSHEQGESVLGIDIGTSTIKLVQLKRKKGKAVLETYGEIALGPYGGQEIGRVVNLTLDKVSEAVKDLIRESGATTSSSGLSLAMASSLVKFIKMPDVDDKQLEQMIPMEARKYIPVSSSEVSINHWLLPKEESPFSEFEGARQTLEDKNRDVLLIAVHNDAINKSNTLVRMSGLSNVQTEIEIFSSIRSITEQSLDPQMIMDFGAGSTKIYIVERGILRASHIVNRGAQDITLALSRSLNVSFDEAESIKKEKGIVQGLQNKEVSDISSINLDFIFSETRRVLLEYQKKYNKNIGQVYLSGGGAALKGLRDVAEINLSVPIKIADPFSKVEYPAFLETILQSVGPEFSVAVGLALRKLEQSE